MSQIKKTRRNVSKREKVIRQRHKSNGRRLITIIAYHFYSEFIFYFLLFFRSHRNTLLSNGTTREASRSVFSELTGIINSSPVSASPPQNACNNRLSGVGVPSSNQGNYHSNNSPIQLSSSLSAVQTSMQHQPFSSTTTTNATQISQQCQQPKSQLLINHKNNDDVFGKIVLGEINLHQTKEIQETPRLGQPNHVTSNDANINQFENLCQNNHESGMITIVTINNNQNTENTNNSIA